MYPKVFAAPEGGYNSGVGVADVATTDGAAAAVGTDTRSVGGRVVGAAAAVGTDMRSVGGRAVGAAENGAEERA